MLVKLIIPVKVLSVATTSLNMLISIRTVSWLTLTAGTPSSMGSSQSTLARISGPSKGVKTGCKNWWRMGGRKHIHGGMVGAERGQEGHYADIRR